jgi:hypothetical protein
MIGIPSENHTRLQRYSDEPRPRSKVSSKQSRQRTPTATPRQSHSGKHSLEAPATPASDSFSEKFSDLHVRGTMDETELLSDSDRSPVPPKRARRSTAKSPLAPPVRSSQRRSPGIDFQSGPGKIPETFDALGLTDFDQPINPAHFHGTSRRDQMFSTQVSRNEKSSARR